MSGLAFDTYGYIPEGLDSNLRPVETNAPGGGTYAPQRRCECCDGHDGLGVYHVRGLAGLRRMLNQSCPGPFAVEDSRGRVVAEVSRGAGLLELAQEWAETRATTARDVRAEEGKR